jgi:threonine synthase
MLNSPPPGGDVEERLSGAGAQGARLRRGDRVAARARAALSKRLGNRLFIKREDLQPVFSFKLRGAYNKMAGLPRKRLRAGVIAASAGNHAQGVALAAQRLAAARSS